MINPKLTAFEIFFADKRDVFIDKSIQDDVGSLADETIKGKLRDLIRDSTVTVVLIGAETGGRWWVDWEIYYSLRRLDEKTRNGLLGIFLPNKQHAVPDRLNDNKHMTHFITWPKSAQELEAAIEKAFLLRNQNPDLRRPLRERNSSRR